MKKLDKINVHDLIVDITLKEGGMQQVSVAQVSEVVKLTLKKLAKMLPKEVDELLARYHED